MRENVLNLIRPAVITLNDDETHPAKERLQWFTHTKAYEKWEKAGTGIIQYRAVSDCSDNNRKGVAAAVAYHISGRYESFAGLELGVGNTMSRTLYYQCDRREAGDDFDLDASEGVQPETLLWSLICQCLIMDCKTFSTINQRFLELDEFIKSPLRDALGGRRTQPIAFLFTILSEVLQLVDSRTVLAIDNIHLLHGSTAGAFINTLRTFVEKQSSQTERKLPTLITSCVSSKVDAQVADISTVVDDTELEGMHFLYD
jgi:hypothetical protein